MARKWQRMTALGRRGISWWKLEDDVNIDACNSTSSTSFKGSFVYQDGKRFVVPLEYINSNIVRELLEISKEGFGLPGDGPIMMSCDVVLMEYAISLLHRRESKEMEMALLATIAGIRCSTSSTCSL